ncbi:MAG: 2-oxo acid dehydrogenase subunit E2, partial [Pseudomonadota bacterium]
MPIAIKMPALSPTMEEGTLAKWLIKVGDKVSSGDIMAEIETDKATMEFEAVDEGTVVSIDVAEGSEGVKVGTVIATIAGEDEDASAPAPAAKAAEPAPAAKATPAPVAAPAAVAAPVATPAAKGDRVVASPLAKRIAADKGVDLSGVKGSGPNGRIVKADVEGVKPAVSSAPASTPAAAVAAAPATASVPDFGIPYEAAKLNNVRKTIARRLTEAKQTIPHIYLTVDIQLDALLKLRGQLNKALEAQGVKLSVNDLIIKALAKALVQVPKCNVSFAGDELRSFTRADISVAVAAPSGLITPIIVDAGSKSVSAIATEMKALAGKARDGKLQPHEYQGGTASLSNLGMFGIKQFDAVINPPQAMIMAVGAGEQRPYVV